MSESLGNGMEHMSITFERQEWSKRGGKRDGLWWGLTVANLEALVAAG